MVLNNRVTRIAGMVSTTHHILAKCCDEIKEESGLYHHKTKKMVNNLLDTIIPLIKLTISDKVLLRAREQGFDIDIEDVHEDINVQVQCMNDFSELLMNGSPNDIYNLNILLSNLVKKKRLYTEEEVQMLNK